MNIEYINWSTDIFQGFYNSNLYDDDMLYFISQDEEKPYDFVDGGWNAFTIDDIDEYHLTASEITQDELWNHVAPEDER